MARIKLTEKETEFLDKYKDHKWYKAIYAQLIASKFRNENPKEWMKISILIEDLYK